MILLTILAIILTILVVFTVLVVSLGGSIFIIIFGDVIVCALVIAWIIGKLLKKTDD